MSDADYVPGSQPPSGYCDWHDWARAQARAGLKQVQCTCGLWRFPQEQCCAVPADPAALTVLSRRERQVIELYAAGKKTAVVARDLSLCVKTIDAHRANIRVKLGIVTPMDWNRLLLAVEAEQRAGVKA